MTPDDALHTTAAEPGAVSTAQHRPALTWPLRLVDAETNPADANRIFLLGAIRCDAGLVDEAHALSLGIRRTGAAELEARLYTLGEGARFLVGHDLKQHDRQAMQARFTGLALLRLPVLDTVQLSALVFPTNPYHRLVNGDKLCSDARNEPLKNARLTLELLDDEVSALSAQTEKIPFPARRALAHSTTIMEIHPEPALPSDAAFAEILQLATRPVTDSVPRLAELLRQAKAADLPWHRAFAMAALAKASYARDADRALAMGREALAQMQRLGSRRGQALAHGAISRSHMERGELAEALIHMEEDLEIERALGDSGRQANALGTMAAVLERVGRCDAGMACLVEALTLLPAHDRDLRPGLQNNLAANLATRARIDRDNGLERAVWAPTAELALAHAEDAFSMMQKKPELRVLRHSNYPRGSTAKALVVLDRLHEALPLLAELQQIHAASGDNFALLYVQLELARAHLQGGDAAQAQAQAQAAISVAEERHVEHHLEELWLVLSRAQELQGNHAAALAAFQNFHRLRLRSAMQSAEQHARVLAVRMDTARAQRESRRDPLTSLLNRRGFDEVLAACLAGASDAKPVSLLLIDLDHFKAVNDRHGHARGDEALVLLAQLLRQLGRPTDHPARLGGDELAWVGQLEGANAQKVAERLRAALRSETAARWPDHPPLTISVGVAETREPLAAALLVKRADVALYAAKAAGRDGVRMG